MKRIFTSLAFVIAASLAFAQTGYRVTPYINAGTNPGGLNTDNEYPVGGGLPGGWTTVRGPSGTPAWSSNQTIPFSFNFNGSAETQYKVSNSGILTFTTTAGTAPTFTAGNLPNAAIPNKSVCVWGIQGTGTNDNVVTKTFGTAPNRQHWIFFSSYTKGSSWTYWSIVLEETTNNIYIVDQRHNPAVTGITVGVQVNGSTAFQACGSPGLGSNAGADPSAADNTYWEFAPGTQAQWDATVSAETVPEYLVIGQAPFNLTGVLTNLGSNGITSADLNYRVNGGSTVTAAGQSVNAPACGSDNITHPTGWTPATTGQYTIDMWASNLNGNADQNTGNDMITFTVSVVDTFVNRKSLLEVFTSSTCGPCAPGNNQMDNVVLPTLSTSDYTVIKYQQNFPGSGDPYQTTEAVNRRGWYGISSIPRMEIDGQWDGNANGFTKPIFDGYQVIPAFMDFTWNKAEYTGNTVNIDVDINPVADINTSTYRTQVVVIEKSTTGNVATNGETIFHNVMMDMIPNENGTASGPFTKGVTVPNVKTSNLTSSNVEQMSDLKAMIWVEDNATKYVLNSDWVDITLAVGIGDIDANGNGIMKMYPNPTVDQTTLKFQTSGNIQVEMKVMNTMGQVVLAENLGTQADGVHYQQINTSNLEAGVYLVTLQMGDVAHTSRLIVQ